MKKIILLFVLSLAFNIASAYYYEFTITQISGKSINDAGEWTDWSEWEDFSGKVTLDTEKEKLIVYASETLDFDVYDKIIDNDADGESSNILQYSCVDDEGNKCLFRLRNSRDGSMQIYVDYDTFSVVYQVETNSNMHTLFSNYYAPNSNKTTTHILTKSSSSHTPKTPTQAQINKMSAKITNVTTDHNVYENGKKGMRIHVKFDANDMLGFAGWCIAWFGDSKKNLLKYYGTSTYTNNSNNILTWGKFTPIYEYATFSDYTIFMPYEELHKEGDMSFYIELQEKTSGKSLATSTWYSFRYGNTNSTYTHEYVDLGLSVKWATCNIGADKPEQYGNYFAWGETTIKNVYTWNTYNYCAGTEVSLKKYNFQANNGKVDRLSSLQINDDAACMNWGGKWRMPTYEEWNELKNNCTWTWTTLNGVYGYKVTSKKTGYTHKSIFLPAAGHYDGATFKNANSSYGNYLSSSLYTDISNSAWYLAFHSNNVTISACYRYCGLSIRPVCP